MLAALGLHADPVSTQIVQRDRHAALLGAIAVLGGSLERFATEVRNLQHTEIGELQEPFTAGQKGSSAMPHKRNPILSERIAGLARLLRGYAGTALEDQPLWHERDISHSSAERVILPDATIVLDYMLVRMTGLVEGLVVRSERMRENIARGLGLHASSRVLVALVESGGLSREDAYAIVQRASLRAADERAPLRDLLAVDPAVAAEAVADPARRLLRRGRLPAARADRDQAARRPGRRASRPAPRSPSRRCPMLLAEHFLRSGKVRDLYELPDGRMLLVASDRISAFDVVLPTAIPDKGRVLTGLSRFWFAETAGDRPEPPARHGSGDRRDGVRGGAGGRRAIGRRHRPDRRAARPDHGLSSRRRSSRSRRSSAATSRARAGRSTSSGARSAGCRCPSGLRESDRLPEPLFTPATKAEQGEHDENIDFDRMVEHIGAWSGQARRGRAGRDDPRPGHQALSVRRGDRRATRASCSPTRSSSSGSSPETGELILIDEVMTPDSSRFWDAAAYEPGGAQASFDKQFVRDWLETQPWDKTAPGPALPEDVVDGTRARYIEAFERITGASFERYLQEDVIAP